MPPISKRGEDQSSSPIRRLIPFAEKAKSEGKHIFHLNIGQPDIPTPVSALSAVRNISDTIVAYGSSKGLPALRGSVAKYYNKFDAGLSSDHVYITTGASEAILFALLASCDNGDEIIIPEPFYANYLGFANLANVKIVPLTLTLENKFKHLDLNDFELLITNKTKAIFLCNPVNPTGQVYSQQELSKLMNIVKRHKLFLIVDEVYREFCYDSSFTSVLSFKGMEDNIIVIDSISKVFSACGARIGFLISKNKAIMKMALKYAQLRLSPPHYGQYLALACYEDSDDYIFQAKLEYEKRREVLFRELSNIKGIKHFKPAATFYSIVELPVDDAELFCKWMLTSFEYKGCSVMVAPASGFYFSKDLGKKQVRIAYVLKEEDLVRAMECLRLGLQVYNSSRMQVDI